MNDLREKLAAQAHAAWSGWMEYLFGKCMGEKSALGQYQDITIPADLVARWSRQMQTPYADLPENEKASDRVEADKYLAILAAPRRMTPDQVEAHFEWARAQVHPDDHDEWRIAKGMRPIEREPNFKISDHGDLAALVLEKSSLSTIAVAERAQCSDRMAWRLIAKLLTYPDHGQLADDPVAIEKQPFRSTVDVDSVTIQCPCGQSIRGEGSVVADFCAHHLEHTNGKTEESLSANAAGRGYSL